MLAWYRFLALALVGAALLFAGLPQVDLVVTSWAFRPGFGFPASYWAWVGWVRSANQALMWTAVALAAILVLLLIAHRRGWTVSLRLNLIRLGRPGRLVARGLGGLEAGAQRRGLLALPARLPACFLLAVALGPGLMANALLKEYSGRPRPSHVTEFRGQQTFVPALTRSDQCARNCSFVSGEVSIAATWLSPALMLAGRARMAGYALTAFLVALAAFVRVAEGGHFLSDTVFAALLTALVCVVLHDRIARGAHVSGQPAAPC